MDRMRIVSVNTATESPIDIGGETVPTGIDKRPAAGRVRISVSGLEGDVICDPEHHGGPDQAVYVYSADDYAWWSAERGTEHPPGLFGENLTIEGLPSDLAAGDRLLIGDVILEATSPRIPCRKLSARADDRQFGLVFRRAERPGFYFRVLNEGDVGAGDAVMLAENTDGAVSMLEMFRLAFDLSPSVADLERCLEAPIAERMRTKFESKLLAIQSAAQQASESAGQSPDV